MSIRIGRRWIEDIRWVRYIDRYRKQEGRWRFAKRVVTCDYVSQRPARIEDGVIGMAAGTRAMPNCRSDCPGAAAAVSPS